MPLRCSLADDATLLSDREDFLCIEKRGSDGEHKTIWLDPSSVRCLKKSRVHLKCMQIDCFMPAGLRGARAGVRLTFAMKEKLNKYPYHGGHVRKSI